MEIKVMGGGCANCKRLLATVEKAVSELGIDAKILYITDFEKIMEAGLLRTPGLLINEKIVVSGRVPDIDEVKKLISITK